MINFKSFSVLAIYVVLTGAAPCDQPKYFLSPERANFFQAFINCQSAGMELASVQNEDEFNALDSYITPYKIEGFANAFWISGTNLNNPTSKQYYWLSTGKPAIYTRWVAWEPDNSLGVQHCMSWALFQGKTGWADDNCENQYRYICEYRSKN